MYWYLAKTPDSLGPAAGNTHKTRVTHFCTLTMYRNRLCFWVDMRYRNPWPSDEFEPEPEGYTNVVLEGTIWKFATVLDPSVGPGRLRRQAYGNRTVIAPTGRYLSEDEHWAI